MLTKANLSRLLANMSFHPIGSTKMARKRHWKRSNNARKKLNMYYQVTLNLIIAVYLICQVKSGSGVRIYSMATNTLLRRYKMPRSTAIPPPCAWKLLLH